MILVAGGDGTVSEAITGLLRRTGGAAATTAIGVLPCGRTNTLAQQLFGYSNADSVSEVKGMATAAMAIVRGKLTDTDVIKVEPIVDDVEHEHASPPARPIFAVGSIQWGAFRDALHKRDKYWYFGPLRDYSAYLFNSISSHLTWECAAELTYSPPCAGCSNCYTVSASKLSSNSKATSSPLANNTRRWWSGYSAPKGGSTRTDGSGADDVQPDLSRVQNPVCHTASQLAVQPHELLLRNNARRSANEIPRLHIQLNGADLSAIDFVKEGWSRIRSEATAAVAAAEREIEVRAVEIRPAPQALYSEEREAFFSIDNEAFEVKPVRVSVVPRAVRLYTT